jgi:predicted ATPase
MTEEQIQDYLRENGYPEYIVRAGKEGLVERYRKFVEEVEQGYRLSIFDYRNDLDIRGMLGMLGVEDDIAAEDDRLRRMLTAPDKRVWESMDGDPWWDFGYPKNASGTLLEDLRNEKLITSASGS